MNSSKMESDSLKDVEDPLGQEDALPGMEKHQDPLDSEPRAGPVDSEPRAGPVDRQKKTLWIIVAVVAAVLIVIVGAVAGTRGGKNKSNISSPFNATSDDSDKGNIPSLAPTIQNLTSALPLTSTDELTLAPSPASSSNTTGTTLDLSNTTIQTPSPSETSTTSPTTARPVTTLPPATREEDNVFARPTSAPSAATVASNTTTGGPSVIPGSPVSSPTTPGSVAIPSDTPAADSPIDDPTPRVTPGPTATPSQAPGTTTPSTSDVTPAPTAKDIGSRVPGATSPTVKPTLLPVAPSSAQVETLPDDTPGDARIARYQIKWSQKSDDDECDLQTYILTMACTKGGIIDLSTTDISTGSIDSNCAKTSNQTLACHVDSANTLAVACYGLSDRDVLLGVAVSPSKHRCAKEKITTGAGGTLHSRVSGSIHLAVEIALLDCTGDPSSISVACAPRQVLDNPPGCMVEETCADESLFCFLDDIFDTCSIHCDIDVDAGSIAIVDSIQSSCIQSLDISSKFLGEACSYNIQCKEGVCAFGVCQDPLPDRSECEESQDCVNLVCAYQDFSYSKTLCCPDGQVLESDGPRKLCKSTAESGALCNDLDDVCVSGACALMAVSSAKICCDAGTTVLYDGNTYRAYCNSQAPPGSNCGPNLHAVCNRGVCVNSICSSELLASGQDCEYDAQCTSGACGRQFVGANVAICCEGNTTFNAMADSTPKDYCWNEAPTGSDCGRNLKEVCASGICAASVCASGPLSSGEECSDSNDCASGACGRISPHYASVPICCVGNTTFIGNDDQFLSKEFCLNEAPAGSYCGRRNNNRLCASGVCTDSACQ